MFINQILDYIEYSFLKENYLVTFHDDLEKEKNGTVSCYVIDNNVIRNSISDDPN